MFFKVKTTEEVLRLLKEFPPVEMETIALEGSLGRVVGEDILSPEDLPGFQRSSMDGYAIRAKDSFGASESLPALLEIAGEVKMGQVPTVTVKEGQAVKIATGGMLPEGADGVVMAEYCHLLDENTIEISRAISPQENVIQPDDDFKQGSVVLPKGNRLRPQDVGVLAGLGLTNMKAYKRPKAAIISTGDEVVPVDRSTKPGQVRDINSYTLGAFCQLRGVEPVILGLCKDRFDQLRSLVEKGLAAADTVWISGGSSVGTRDLTLKVFESFADMEILVHGISISPGKPTVIARMGRRAVFGLPGHTASAMVVAEVFLGPFLATLSGVGDFTREGMGEVEATLSRNIESAGGRDDFIRVKLTKGEKGWVAEPVFGKSGLISTLVEADGLLRVDRNTEGLYQGDRVKVMVFKTSRGGLH